MEYDLTSTLIYYLVAMNCVMGVPTTYCMYVLWDVYRRNLLPSKGKRRQLSLYILRLVFVFFFMWIPFTLVGSMGSIVQYDPWIHWSCVVYSHVQAAVSVCVAMTKPDIQQAVIHTITCRDTIQESDEVIMKRRNSQRRKSAQISGFSTGEQLRRRGRSSLAVSFLNKFQTTMALFWGGRSSTMDNSTHPSTLDNTTPGPSAEKSSKRFSATNNSRRSASNRGGSSIRFSATGGAGSSRLSFGNNPTDRSIDSLTPLSSLPLSTIPISTTHHESTIPPMMEDEEEEDDNENDGNDNVVNDEEVEVEHEIVFMEEDETMKKKKEIGTMDDDEGNGINGNVGGGGGDDDDDDDHDDAGQEQSLQQTPGVVLVVTATGNNGTDVESGDVDVAAAAATTTSSSSADLGNNDNDGDYNGGDIVDYDDYDSDDSSLVYA